MNPLRRRDREVIRDHEGRRGVRRAVVLMPNGLTLFNLFCGIYAIILSVHGRVAEAPGFILLGGIADALDGRVARATGTGSRFGEELDSLVDAISFGFAPALLVYLARPADMQGNLDWLLVFIFTACAVMRLARFNVEQAGRKKTHFHGLPSPAAGLTLATYYWFAQTPLYNQTVILFTDSRTLATLPWPNMMRGLMALLAALMVSDVPYPAVPSIGFNSVRRLLGTLTVAASLVLLLVRREEFIFPALLAYVLYGIIKWMIFGFIGRSSTPDQLFWEREAELHQEDERRSAFDRPHLSKEVLEDIDEELDEAPVRGPRERSSRRDEARRDAREEKDREQRRGKRREREGRDREGREREPRESREPREPRERGEAPKRERAEGSKRERRDEGRKEEPRRDEARREEARHDEQPRREEPRRERPPRAEPAVVAAAAEPASIIDPSIAADPTLDNLPNEDRRDPDRAPDDEMQVRKRRRRRGRGRSRGERGERGERAQAGESSAEGSSNDDGGSDFAPESRGDVPPGPTLPDTPSPSGPEE